MDPAMIPNDIDTFTKWVKQRGYCVVFVKEVAEFTGLGIRDNALRTTHLIFYKDSNSREFVTNDNNLPFDIPAYVFENDPYLHWSYGLGCIPVCGLCVQETSHCSFCSQCYRRRLIGRAGLIWALISSHPLLNKDAAGHIARAIVCLMGA